MFFVIACCALGFLMIMTSVVLLFAIRLTSAERWGIACLVAILLASSVAVIWRSHAIGP